MTDQQKAQVALTVAYRTCQDALSLLSSPAERSAPESPNPPPDLKTLHTDFLSLLSLLYDSITKIALVLKPSSPVYTASLSPLKDISDRTSALAHCALMFDGKVHGVTLCKELILVVKDVIDGIGSLVQFFLSAPASDDASYLVRAGAAHNLIDIAKQASADNVTAARKRLLQDKESIEDGVRELSEAIAQAQAEDDDGEDEDWGSDEWEELGFSPSKKMSDAELGRSKKVFTVLRLSALLHKRILQDVLKPTDVAAPVSALDSLPPLSQALLSASDDLVSTLYPPQNLANVGAELEIFGKVISSFRDTIKDFFSPALLLETQMANMDLGERSLTAKNDAASVKWFETCFDQILTALENLGRELG